MGNYLEIDAKKYKSRLNILLRAGHTHTFLCVDACNFIFRLLFAIFWFCVSSPILSSNFFQIFAVCLNYYHFHVDRKMNWGFKKMFVWQCVANCNIQSWCWSGCNFWRCVIATLILSLFIIGVYIRFEVILAIEFICRIFFVHLKLNLQTNSWK